MTFSECLGWYRNKCQPPVTVTIINPGDRRKNGPKIHGRLVSFSNQHIKIVINDTKTGQEIQVDNIKSLELSWCDDAFPRMGELDGTGMEGLPIPTRNWRHRITRGPGNQWNFQEVSSTPGPDYYGAIYRARYGQD